MNCHVITQTPAKQSVLGHSGRAETSRIACAQLLNATALEEESAESEQLSADFPGGKLARHGPARCSLSSCKADPALKRSHACQNVAVCTTRASLVHTCDSQSRLWVVQPPSRTAPYRAHTTFLNILAMPQVRQVGASAVGADMWCTWTRRTGSWPAPPSRACPPAACCCCTRSAHSQPIQSSFSWPQGQSQGQGHSGLRSGRGKD